MKRKLWKAIVLAGMALLVCVSPFQSKAGNVTVEEREAKQRDYMKVSPRNRENIRHAMESCEEDGAQSARRLNKIRDNKRDFEAGVRCVMDEYYSMEKSERGELENFEEMVDGSAETIMEHYEEAEEERDNSGNLDYRVFDTCKIK